MKGCFRATVKIDLEAVILDVASERCYTPNPIFNRLSPIGSLGGA